MLSTSSTRSSCPDPDLFCRTLRECPKGGSATVDRTLPLIGDRRWCDRDIVRAAVRLTPSAPTGPPRAGGRRGEWGGHDLQDLSRRRLDRDRRGITPVAVAGVVARHNLVATHVFEVDPEQLRDPPGRLTRAPQGLDARARLRFDDADLLEQTCALVGGGEVPSSGALDGPVTGLSLRVQAQTRRSA